MQYVTIEIILLLIGVFACSVLLTTLIRKYAISRQIVDIPNQRSSHTQVTPRGGGVSILISFSLSLLILFFYDNIELNTFLAFFFGGLVVGAIGFLDDHQDIQAVWRLIVHFLAALWAIYWIGGHYVVDLQDGILQHGVYADLAAIFIIVWLLNLYNFMDGIDGIASIEAITTANFAAILIYMNSPIGEDGYDYILLLLILIASVCGFLVWNWPPAKIFMGDGGSSYLGYLFALFAIATAVANIMSIWAWFILLGVFIVDATFTLFSRIVQGERWYEAHRSHAYQIAARKWNSHCRVTVAVLFINIFWLFPLAGLAASIPEWGIALTVFAYMPLIILAIKLRAGKL